MAYILDYLRVGKEKYMGKKHLLILILVSFGSLWACSDVGFRSLPSQACIDFNDGGDQNCTIGPDGVNTFEVSFRTGDVDIIVVNDNSGSMYHKQQKMSERFGTFIQSIDHLFYQVAMITTDISKHPSSFLNEPRPANGFGAFQDGKFLEFLNSSGQGTGRKILRWEDGTEYNTELFRTTVQRDETLMCEESDHHALHCPSGDERGIYALNLAVNRNEQNFFRPGAHLAVIILSDEDVRSNGGHPTNSVWQLQTNDLPETFLENMQNRFSSKTVSVHSVIIRPNDSVCLAQNRETLPNGNEISGQYGRYYAELSRPDIYGGQNNPRRADRKSVV